MPPQLPALVCASYPVYRQPLIPPGGNYGEKSGLTASTLETDFQLNSRGWRGVSDNVTEMVTGDFA